LNASLEAARQHEQSKYQSLYGQHATYGSENHGADALPLVEQMRPTSLLDVGCGRNLFCPLARRQGIEAYGVDLVCPDADVIAPAHALPFPSRCFDVLTAFDLCEHLLPHEVHEVLAEFDRIAPRWILSICYRDSDNRVNGETLHPTVRSQQWWTDTLRQFGAVREWRGYLLVKVR